MIRARIQQVIEGAIKRFNALGRANETITDRECFQHYGFTSRPLEGAEAVLIANGNHIVMIAEDDRRYRIAIEAGEVCLYTDEGDHIRFKRGKEIYIQSGNKLTAEIANDVAVTTKRIALTASESITLTSPSVTVDGALSATGNVTSQGSITDTTGNTNHHSH
jgi:phage baseplate assembly protein V